MKEQSELTYVVLGFDNAEQAAKFVNDGDSRRGQHYARLISGDELNGIKRYNGWINYETWLINLWISNDQWSSEAFEEWIREQGRDHLSDYVAPAEAREWIEENILGMDDGDYTGLMKADMISAFLSEVDWIEILEHAVADIEWPEDEDEDQDGEA